MAVEETPKTTEAAPQEGSEEYNKAMMETYDASKAKLAEDIGEAPPETPAVEVQEKPEGVPDKFYNKETGEVDYASLTKSYNELEKGRGKAKPVEANIAPAGLVSSADAVILAQVKHDAAKETAEADDATEEDKLAFNEASDALTLAQADAISAKKTEIDEEAARAIVEKTGIDFDGLAQEYQELGGLSEASVDNLVAQGIPKATVESYIRGQEALATQWEAEAKSEVGGEEGYATLTKWASTNLSADDVQAYDTVVNGGDINAVKLAVRGLKAQFEEANGKEPKLLGGTSGSSSSSSGYNSRAEMVQDMSDPRYAKDSAYRQQIANKVAKTTAF